MQHNVCLEKVLERHRFIQLYYDPMKQRTSSIPTAIGKFDLRNIYFKRSEGHLWAEFLTHFKSFISLLILENILYSTTFSRVNSSLYS